MGETRRYGIEEGTRGKQQSITVGAQFRQIRMEYGSKRAPNAGGGFDARQHILPAELKPVTVMNNVPEPPVEGQVVGQLAAKEKRQAVTRRIAEIAGQHSIQCEDCVNPGRLI